MKNPGDTSHSESAESHVNQTYGESVRFVSLLSERRPDILEGDSRGKMATCLIAKSKIPTTYTILSQDFENSAPLKGASFS